MPSHFAIPPEEQPEQAIPGDSNDQDTEGHRGRSLIEEPSPEGLHGRSLTGPTDEDDTEGHRGRA